MVSKHGGECDFCGKVFEYRISVPYGGISSPGYTWVDFGKYKPSRAWFCRSHSNIEIEQKLKELDV
jgi:hypothetical protein